MPSTSSSSSALLSNTSANGNIANTRKNTIISSSVSDGLYLSPFEPPVWADLWDPRRFDPSLPITVSCTSEHLEGDAELLAECRTGPVYRQRVQGRDCVFKVLIYSAWRDELDDEKHVYPTKIRAELERERDAYARLGVLQGDVVPRFIWHGELVPDMADTLITEYAGVAIAEWNEELQKGALDALEAVHAEGVLHGDVARRNFLLESRGPSHKVVLIDFAQARFIEEFTSTDWAVACAEERVQGVSVFSRSQPDRSSG